MAPKPVEDVVEVTRVVWSPCGTRFATSSLDGTAAVWAITPDELGCQRVATLRGHDEGVTCVAYPCGVLRDNSTSEAPASKLAARPVAKLAESSDATKRE